MSISPIRLHTALGRQRIISCLPPTTVSLKISSFHPNSQMYHIWAVSGELQCYQWCLFLLIGCNKRVSTAWNVRAPLMLFLRLVPQHRWRLHSTTHLYHGLSHHHRKRVSTPARFGNDSYIHFVYASSSYSSPWSISSFMSSTITQSTKLDCWPPRPYDHPFDCFCFKCLPRSHIAQPYRKRYPTVTLDPEVGSFISNITFKGLKH